jgi:dihydrofolate reductase
MRKVILFNMMTLDGFFSGPNGELDWHNVDAEFNKFAIDQLDTAGGLIFGRVTYLGMASYWPTPIAIQNDPIVAGKMNSIPKIVVSTTLDRAEWDNTRLVKEDAAAEIGALRLQPGPDWYIFGSANLAAGLTRKGLIDEYRVMVNPVILGSGVPLFAGSHTPLHLKLVNSRAFRSGNVLLYYQPDKK